MYIDWCNHAIHKHSSRSLCYLHAHLCFDEFTLSFFKTKSVMHRRLFEGRHLVLFAKIECCCFRIIMENIDNNNIDNNYYYCFRIWKNRQSEESSSREASASGGRCPVLPWAAWAWMGACRPSPSLSWRRMRPRPPPWPGGTTKLVSRWNNIHLILAYQESFRFDCLLKFDTKTDFYNMVLTLISKMFPNGFFFYKKLLRFKVI